MSVCHDEYTAQNYYMKSVICTIKEQYMIINVVNLYFVKYPKYIVT